MKIERELLELARRECANHQREGNRGLKDYCLLEPQPDHRCLFATSEGRRCKYFEEAVLPLDAELQALYLAHREARAHGDELTEGRAAQVVAAVRVEATCAKCGRRFTPKSNRQKYCPACQLQMSRETQRAYRQRQKGSRVIVRAS